VPLKHKALMLLLVALLAGVFCSGCWSRREPELLSLVLAVGFDYDEEEDLYQVFAQVANPIASGTSGGSSSDGSGGGGGGGKKPYATMEAKGHTPFEAIRNLIQVSTRELFWAHCRVLLFSESLARKGIKEVLDLFERERQFRLIVKPVVVDGDLRKLMEADFPLEESGARGLDRLIVTTRFARSIFPEINLNEFMVNLAQPGREMVMGRIEVLDTGQSGSEGGGESVSTVPARIGGGALFRGGRMVGWATAKQIQGWTYVAGRAFRSNFVIESPLGKGNRVSIEVLGHDARMKLRGNEDNWRIELEVKLHGRITDYSGPGDLGSESEFTRSLERRAAAAARNRIEAMLSRAQELKSDVFGFGNLIYRKRPQLWKKLAPDWEEKIFPELAVDLKVEFKLLRPGLVKEYLPEGPS